MRNNIAMLQRELNAYIAQGNDFMIDKIQELIDKELKNKNNHKLNEIVEINEPLNLQTLND